MARMLTVGATPIALAATAGRAAEGRATALGPTLDRTGARGRQPMGSGGGFPEFDAETRLPGGAPFINPTFPPGTSSAEG